MTQQTELRDALEESQSLFAAMLHEPRPIEEIQRQMLNNRAALEAKQAEAHDDVGFELWWADHEPNLGRDEAHEKWISLLQEVQLPEPVAAESRFTSFSGDHWKWCSVEHARAFGHAKGYEVRFLYTEQQVRAMLAARGSVSNVTFEVPACHCGTDAATKDTTC